MPGELQVSVPLFRVSRTSKKADGARGKRQTGTFPTPGPVSRFGPAALRDTPHTRSLPCAPLESPTVGQTSRRKITGRENSVQRGPSSAFTWFCNGCVCSSDGDPPGRAHRFTVILSGAIYQWIPLHLQNTLRGSMEADLHLHDAGAHPCATVPPPHPTFCPSTGSFRAPPLPSSGWQTYLPLWWVVRCPATRSARGHSKACAATATTAPPRPSGPSPLPQGWA